MGGYQHIYEVVHDIRKIIYTAKEYLKVSQCRLKCFIFTRRKQNLDFYDFEGEIKWFPLSLHEIERMILITSKNSLQLDGDYFQKCICFPFTNSDLKFNSGFGNY